MQYSEVDEQRLIGSKVDFRGEFGRDRDRILFCSAFRRLAGKTQVVAAGELGDFHTRMTHSLKVAQMGRRIGQRLGRVNKTKTKVSLKRGRPDPDPELVEAACLAHDLGHPPFGHAGEIALMKVVDELVIEKVQRQKGRPLTDREALTAVTEYGGFEGNAQTLRILTRLSARQPYGSKGLDLTRATLDATIKYPWVRQETGKGLTKWNVYPDDLECATWIRLEHALGPGSPQCFEAQLMDWCDDVTYACHDMEDFYRAGIIPLYDLLTFPPRPPGSDAPDDVPSILDDFLRFVEAKWTKEGKPWNRHDAIVAMRGISQLMALPAAFTGSRYSKVALHTAISTVMTYFIESVTWTGDAACRYEGELVIDSGARLRCDLLQAMIWYFVIGRQALASQQIGQQQIVRDLLRIYHGCEDDGRLLPDDRKEEIWDHQDFLRGCIDHVASMTEAGALAMYHRLTGVRVGLHSDPIWRV